MRAALAGAEDRGDVHAYPTGHGYRLVIEVKAGEQCANPTMTQIRRWQSEATAEAARVPDADAAVLVLKRRGSAKPADWPAWVTVGDIEAWFRPPLESTAKWAYQWVCLPFGELIDHLEVDREPTAATPARPRHVTAHYERTSHDHAMRPRRLHQPATHVDIRTRSPPGQVDSCHRKGYRGGWCEQHLDPAATGWPRNAACAASTT